MSHTRHAEPAPVVGPVRSIPSVRSARSARTRARAVVAPVVLALAVGLAAAGCSASHSSTPAIGQQTTLPQTKGYTCKDPVGDISLDPKASGTLTQPAGIDIVQASALVKGDVLAVEFTTNGPIASVAQPLFDVQQGDPSVNPELSWELRAQPLNAADPGGQWNVVLHTFKGGTEAKTDLGAPVTVQGNTLAYQVPLSQLPGVVSVQWQFGAASTQPNGSVPFDDCSSFSSSTTSTAKS